MTRRAFIAKLALSPLLAGCGIGARLGFELAPAARGVGVLLLHGKFGDPAGDFAELAPALRRVGYVVATPELAWSHRRRFDGTLDEAFDEIADEVAGLRWQGLNRVVLGGFSLGGNVALAYAARRGDVDALVLLGPGFTPERPAFRTAVAGAVEAARSASEAGRGDTIGSFLDYAYDGAVYPLDARARAYLSYYAPTSDVVMPINAMRLTRAMPVLWVVGRADKIIVADRSYVFDRLPPHRDSRFLTIESGHLDTPAKAAPTVAGWLGELS
jgi:pimeloyl-ACP methyl ester carboxylesterase